MMIGQMLGNFRITKLLGEGGMGVVYLAEHPGIGRKAAVKVLHPGLAQNQEIVGRFFNEARVANAIHHPGIVDVLDFGTLTSGAQYIVMEFLDGESLASRIKRKGRLTLADSVDIALQAASALGAAHSNGIVHRDLKPDNLFLVPDLPTTDREIVKVLDFGIAKLGAGPMRGELIRTRTGSVMGTPVYMSPEQCRGTKGVDHRTDVYALGVILYEMLCGDPPFCSDGHGELLYLHISATPTPPRTRNPAIPLQVENVILRALAKDPTGRIQTMDEFWRLLSDAATARRIPQPQEDLSGSGGSDSSRRRADPTRTRGALRAGAAVLQPRPTQSRRWTWRLSVGIGVVTIAAAALVAVRSAPREGTVPTSSPTSATVEPGAIPRRSAPAGVPPVSTAVSVKLVSQPPGARVLRERDGTLIGVTPLERSRSTATGIENLSIELDGYESEQVALPLDKSVNFVFALKKTPPARPEKPTAVRSGRSDSVRVEDLSDEELLRIYHGTDPAIHPTTANQLSKSSARDHRLSPTHEPRGFSAPSQEDISHIIEKNRQGIQTCYQRALLRDNSLADGNVTVRVTVGRSGKVESIHLDGPLQFRALEPCIRDVMSRWAFPPWSEEYGTEIPVVLRANREQPGN
jgi:serine/threonine protein kinase